MLLSSISSWCAAAAACLMWIVPLLMSVLISWVLMYMMRRYMMMSDSDIISGLAFTNLNRTAAGGGGGVFPCSMPWIPLFSDTIAFHRDPRGFIQSRFDALSRLLPAPPQAFTANVYGTTMLFVRGPTHVFRQVLLNEKLCIPNWIKCEYDVILRETMFVQKDTHQHRISRKVIGAALSGGRAMWRSYTEHIDIAASHLVRKWSTKQGTQDAFADIVEYLFSCVIMNMFGREFYVRRGKQLQHCLNQMVRVIWFSWLPFDLPCTPFRRALDAKRVFLEAIDAEIRREIAAAKVATAEEAAEEPTTMLQHILKHVNYLEDGSFSIERLKAELLFMVWAGYEPGSTSLIQTIVEMAKRPEILQKIRRLQKEQEHAAQTGSDAVKGEQHESPAVIVKKPAARTTTIMNKYLDKVVLEAMRSRTVSFMLTRLVISPFSIGDCKVERGWEIALCIGAHETQQKKKKQMQTQAQEADDDKQTRAGSNGTMQFGAGMHGCPGRQLAFIYSRALLCALAKGQRQGQVCVLEMQPEAPVWIDEPALSRPRYSIHIRLTTSI